MIGTVKSKNIKYDFQLEKITQFAGGNILLKTFILESLSKHFSNYKYLEYEECYRNNIKLDGTVPGREYYDFYRISNLKDIQSQINITKTSLMLRYIKERFQEFEIQDSMIRIDELLSNIFMKLNDDMTGPLGNVTLDYRIASLMEMVQKSRIYSSDGQELETMSNKDVLMVFIDLLKELLSRKNKKTIVAFENIDHILTAAEYKDVLAMCYDISERYDIYFIFTISLDGFIQISKDNITGVNVFNEGIYCFPEYDRVKQYIEDRYPIYIKMEDEEMIKSLQKASNLIGRNEIVEMEQLIVQKILNSSIPLSTDFLKRPTPQEIACLCTKDML